MRKVSTLALLWILLLVGFTAFASPSQAEQSPLLRSADDTDVFGTIIRTLPSSPPPMGGTWGGCCWANGMLMMVANGPLPPSHIIPVNPANGTLLTPWIPVAIPGGGQISGITFDGTNYWICEINTNWIYQINPGGFIVTGFPSPTNPYTAYAITYDQPTGNLWVGANLQNPRQTELYGITPQGTILIGIPTTNNVMWYRDIELNYQIPSIMKDLFVVDNYPLTTTNRILHLKIGVSSVITFGSIPSPETGGQGGAGITFDGHYLWHNGYTSAAGLVWCLDDGLYPPTFEVSTWMANPPVTIPRAGGSFQYYISVHNLTNLAQTIYIKNKVKDVNGINYTVWGPINRVLAPNAFPTRMLTQSINLPSLPAGWASFITLVGTTATTATDSNSFPIYQSATFADQYGSFENTCWGELPGDPVPENPIVPDRLEMKGSFPNPFNPRTAISYQLSAISFVNLSVYDISGREVMELVNGYRDAGSHEVTFDGSNLPSGVYLARLQAGGYTGVQKLVLLK